MVYKCIHSIMTGCKCKQLLRIYQGRGGEKLVKIQRESMQPAERQGCKGLAVTVQ